MRAVGVPHLAEEYAALRVRVVNSFLLELTVTATVHSPLLSAEDAGRQETTSAEGYGIVHPYELEWQRVYCAAG